MKPSIDLFRFNSNQKVAVISQHYLLTTTILIAFCCHSIEPASPAKSPYNVIDPKYHSKLKRTSSTINPDWIQSQPQEKSKFRPLRHANHHHHHYRRHVKKREGQAYDPSQPDFNPLLLLKISSRSDKGESNREMSPKYYDNYNKKPLAGSDPSLILQQNNQDLFDFDDKPFGMEAHTARSAGSSSVGAAAGRFFSGRFYSEEEDFDELLNLETREAEARPQPETKPKVSDRRKKDGQMPAMLPKPSASNADEKSDPLLLSNDKRMRPSFRKENPPPPFDPKSFFTNTYDFEDNDPVGDSGGDQAIFQPDTTESDQIRKKEGLEDSKGEEKDGGSNGSFGAIMGTVVAVIAIAFIVGLTFFVVKAIVDQRKRSGGYTYSTKFVMEKEDQMITAV